MRKVKEAYEESKAEQAQAEKAVVFNDVADVETAIAEMRMMSKGEERNLTADLSKISVTNKKELDKAVDILKASIEAPTKRQLATTLILAQAFDRNKNRVIFELPAGHGKSYIMLLVAGIMLKKGSIKSVELIYH